MTSMSVARKRQNESGANLVEYILLIAFIAIIVILTVKVLGVRTRTVDAQVCGHNKQGVLTSQGYFIYGSASDLRDLGYYRFTYDNDSNDSRGKVNSVVRLPDSTKTATCG